MSSNLQWDFFVSSRVLAPSRVCFASISLCSEGSFSSLGKLFRYPRGRDHSNRVSVRTASKRPVVLAIRNQNGKVVDGCESRRHKPIIIEFPVLIAVGAIPAIRVVVPLVSEAYGDSVPGLKALIIASFPRISVAREAV